MEVAPWPFVGRHDVMARCRDTLDAGRSVLVAGPAGVGKTQVARELADAYERTHRVVRMVASFSVGVPVAGLADDDGPVLLVIDDIPLLDADTAHLVASRVVAGSLVLLATMRTESGGPVGPGAAAMTLLWKDDHVARVDLAAFSRDELNGVLDLVLRAPIDGLTRRRLWDLTQGSPLFARELVRSSVADGSLRRVDGMWRLDGSPHSNRLDELVEQRLRVLDQDGLDVVELVALGEPVGFAGLLRAVGSAAVDHAEQSGLVEVVVDELRHEVRMVHPIFGDVARRRLTAVRSATHHTRLLSMIESTPMRRRDDIVRAATWQIRAGGTPVTDDMLLAARRALYERDQWLAIELASSAARSHRIEAALVVSQAFADLGQPERAVRLLSEFGGDLTDADAALLAIQRSVTSFWGLGDADTADRLLLDAEEAVVGQVWRDELRAERAVFAATRGSFARALEIAEDLIDESQPPRVFVTAAIAGAVAFALDGRSVDSVALATRAFAVGAVLTPELGMSDPSIHLVASALASSEAGDLAASESLGRAARGVSVTDGNRTGQAWFSLVLGRTMLLRGRPSAAAELFAESAATFGWMHSPGPQRWAIAGLVQSWALVGDGAAAERAWADLGAVMDHPARMMGVEVDRAGAWLLCARGDIDGAIDRLREVADGACTGGAWSLAGAVLHDIARLGGRVDHDGIARVAGAQGTLAPLRAAAASASQHEDPTAYETVAEGFASIGADLFAAEMFERAGTLHAAPREVTRCRRRAAALHRATNEDWIVTLAIAADTPAGRGAVRVPALVTPELTQREREIAELAAGGSSNRAIAETLFVSVRTVENHLQHVYDKLGIAGRRELGAWMTTIAPNTP